MTGSATEGHAFADWKALGEVANAYAHHAGRGDPKQAAVFATNGQVRLAQGNPASTDPIKRLVVASRSPRSSLN